MSDSLWPRRLQHARLPCPPLSPGVCSNSCQLSWWCHSTISSSVAPFFSCPQSFPASRSSQVALVVKNPPANAGNERDTGLIPGSGRFPGIGNGNPLLYSCLGNPMDKEAWRATVYGVTKSWTRPSAHTHTHTCKHTQTIKDTFPFYDDYGGSDGAKCLMSGIDWVLGLSLKDFSLANLRGQWVAPCFLGPEIQTSGSQNVFLGPTTSASSGNLLEIQILHSDLLNQKPWSWAPTKWVKKAFQEILMYITSEKYWFRQVVMPQVGDCGIVIWHELILLFFLCQSLG